MFLPVTLRMLKSKCLRIWLTLFQSIRCFPFSIELDLLEIRWSHLRCKMNEQCVKQIQPLFLCTMKQNSSN